MKKNLNKKVNKLLKRAGTLILTTALMITSIPNNVFVTTVMAADIPVPQNMKAADIQGVDPVDGYEFVSDNPDTGAKIYAFIGDSEYTYTGGRLTPNVDLKITNDGTDFWDLTQNVHYTLDYDYDVSNNRNNAGTNTITVTCKADNGTINFDTFIIEFDVAQRSLTNPTVTTDALSYTGADLTPNYTVSFQTLEGDSYTLIEGIDYDISPNTVLNAGEYSPVVRLGYSNLGIFTIGDSTHGNFKFEGNVYSNNNSTFTVSRKDLTNTSVIDHNGDTVNVDITATLSNNEGIYYDGTSKEVTETVVCNVNYKNVFTDGYTPIASDFQTYVLTKDVDYSVSYENNVEVGSASIIISPLGDKFTFPTITKTFTINPFNAIGGGVTIESGTWYYTGSEIRPSVMEININKLGGDNIILTEDDYDVSYSNNINVGTGLITITGKGNYVFTSTKSFLIEAETVNIDKGDGNIGDNSILNVYDSYLLEGAIKTKINPIVKVGGIVLTEDVDYKITYSESESGTYTPYGSSLFLASTGQYYYKIESMGNYSITGTATSGTFNVIEAAAELTNIISYARPEDDAYVHDINGQDTVDKIYFNDQIIKAGNVDLANNISVTLFKGQTVVDSSKYQIVGTYDVCYNDIDIVSGIGTEEDIDLAGTLLKPVTKNAGMKMIRIEFKDNQYYYLETETGDYFSGNAVIDDSILKKTYDIFYMVNYKQINIDDVSFFGHEYTQSEEQANKTTTGLSSFSIIDSTIYNISELYEYISFKTGDSPYDIPEAFYVISEDKLYNFTNDSLTEDMSTIALQNYPGLEAFIFEEGYDFPPSTPTVSIDSINTYQVPIILDGNSNYRFIKSGVPTMLITPIVTMEAINLPVAPLTINETNLDVLGEDSGISYDGADTTEDFDLTSLLEINGPFGAYGFTDTSYTVSATPGFNNTDVSRDSNGYIIAGASITISPGTDGLFTFEPYTIEYKILPVEIFSGVTTETPVINGETTNTTNGNLSTGTEDEGIVAFIGDVFNNIKDFFLPTVVRAASTTLSKTVPYTGTPKTISIYHNSNLLVEGVDYTVSLNEAMVEGTTLSPINVGTYIYDVEIINNNFIEFGQVIEYTIDITKRDMSGRESELNLLETTRTIKDWLPTLKLGSGSVLIDWDEIQSITIEQGTSGDVVYTDINDFQNNFGVGLDFHIDEIVFDGPNLTGTVTDVGGLNLVFSPEQEVISDLTITIPNIVYNPLGWDNSHVIQLSEPLMDSGDYDILDYAIDMDVPGNTATIDASMPDSIGSYIIRIEPKDPLDSNFTFPVTSGKFQVVGAESTDTPDEIQVSNITSTSMTLNALLSSTNEDGVFGYKKEGDIDYTWVLNQKL